MIRPSNIITQILVIINLYFLSLPWVANIVILFISAKLWPIIEVKEIPDDFDT